MGMLIVMKSKPIRCLIHTCHLTILRGDELEGTAHDLDGEPVLLMKADRNGTVELTFNDIETIMDCWNAMKERQQNKSNNSNETISN